MNEHYLRRMGEQGISEEELIVEARAEKINKPLTRTDYGYGETDLHLFLHRIRRR